MLNIGVNATKYVKVWEVEVMEKYVKVKLGSSSKDGNGGFKNSTWFSNFVGQAKDNAANLVEGDLIEITQGGVENIWNKDQQKSYLNVVVFGFEMMEGYEKSSKGDSSKESSKEVTDEDIPDWMKD